MNVTETGTHSAGDTGAANGSDDTGLKAWVRPELTLLRAGAAESTPGTTIIDGLLEAIGS